MAHAKKAVGEVASAPVPTIEDFAAPLRTSGPEFVCCGGQLVNLLHVVSVDLPVEGDPKKPLTLKLVNGCNLSLTGDVAAAVLAKLNNRCG